MGSSARRQVRAWLNPPGVSPAPQEPPPGAGEANAPALSRVLLHCANICFGKHCLAPSPAAKAARTRHRGRILLRCKTVLFIEGKQLALSWPHAPEKLREDLGPSLERGGEMLLQPMEPVGSSEGTLCLQLLLATSTAGKSPRKGGSGAGGGFSTLSRSTPGCRECGRGNVGCSGPLGVHARLGAPQNPRTYPGDTPAVGRALGRAGNLLQGFRGKSQPFLCYFSTPFHSQK